MGMSAWGVSAEEECLSGGCLPGDVCYRRGCLPGGRVSAQGGVCLGGVYPEVFCPRGVYPGDVLPRGQTNTCENIVVADSRNSRKQFTVAFDDCK